MLSIRLVPARGNPGVRRVNKLLRDVAEATGDWRRPLEIAAQEFYEHTQEWMDSKGEGTWAPLSPRTISEKRHLGYAYPERPLYRTGKLYASATGSGGPYQYLSINPRRVNISLRGAPWWRYHQEGGRNLPARPIFVVTDKYVARVAEVLAEHMHDAMGGS